MGILGSGLLALVPVQDGKDSIWDRLEFYANGRLRGEATFDNVDGSGNSIDDRYRGRMRFRIGAKYKLDDDVKFEGRFSTASDGNDANNPHWDFGDGDGFNGSGMVMDRFFLDWTADDELHVIAGKQPHAFLTPPIFPDFIWDQDISPAGVAAIWKPKSQGAGFDARAAGYVATEVAADVDPKMWGAQGNAYIPFQDGKVQVSTALYDWGDNQATAVAGNQGNTSTTAHFQIWESFVSATIPGGPLDEMTGFLELMNNLEQSSDDQGWVIGGQLGSNTWKKGAYNAFLVLYDMDANAVFSPVSQDDTQPAGTGIGNGMQGIIVGGTYFWKDNIAVKLWALTGNADGADSATTRVRLDLDFNIK